MPAVFAVLAATLAACGSSSPSGSGGAAATSAATSGPGSSAAVMLKSANTSLGTVLTDARGFTLYWFAIDTPASSKCTGSCTTYWPPVTGTPQAASGVSLPGRLGTITRPDGSVQATYNGHPLYTYSGDKSPGQTNGNKVNGSGGLWYAMTVTAGAGGGSSTAPSGGGGY
jgi:predicted lipoprotein with Yx(FWY)xxD motif